MTKSKFFVISDSIEITTDKAHTKYLPATLSSEEIENLYFAQNHFDPIEVGEFDTEEEALSSLNRIRVSTRKMGFGPKYWLAEVAYIEERSILVDEDGEFIDYEYVGIDHFVCDPVTEEETDD